MSLCYRLEFQEILALALSKAAEKVERLVKSSIILVFDRSNRDLYIICQFVKARSLSKFCLYLVKCPDLKYLFKAILVVDLPLSLFLLHVPHLYLQLSLPLLSKLLVKELIQREPLDALSPLLGLHVHRLDQPRLDPPPGRQAPIHHPVALHLPTRLCSYPLLCLWHLLFLASVAIASVFIIRCVIR